MPGQVNPYKITRTRASSTRDLGYRSLADHAGPVPHGQPAQPIGHGQAAAFSQGIADAGPQPHHAGRSFVMGLVVGAVVGDAVARMRGRR